MMRCKHPTRHRVETRFAYQRSARRLVEGGLKLYCELCGSWLSFGESNDSPPAVKIEILAAFLIANANAFVNVAHVDEHQLDWGSFREDCIGCQAEHLAWDVIARHDEAVPL